MIKDKLQSIIFGHAIGDALGLATEFMSKGEIAKCYPNGVNSYKDIVQDRHRSRWQQGAWTDDTDQMLCIMDSILENKTVDLLDIASRFVSWMKNDGMGVGRHTHNLLSLKDYLTAPHKASELLWNMSQQRSAPNGGIMRNSIVGCWDYANWEQVSLNTENICKLTHFDPRCVGSCVLISFVISCNLQNKPFSKEDLISLSKQYDSRIEEYLTLAFQPDINLLELSEDGKIGYTLKAISAGLWAYYNGRDFESTLKDIILQGGDADTNGAVASALLGLKLGYESILKEWKEELLGKGMLQERIKLFSDLMDI